MKPCFGYVRVSTLKQGEGVSLEAQKEAIERFAASNGIEITRWYEEKVTAAKSGRPEFNAMLKALRKGRAAGVVMHKIDRSARNFRDWATIGELADAGIDVHVATESLDFRSRGGRLSADIQAVIAADYIRNLKEEVRKGIDGRLQQGLYPFCAPIGYRNNGGGRLKTIDPVRGPLVRQAFELYASGRHSIRSLQAEMRRRGLRNAAGTPLSKGAIETLLGNPFYAGVIRIRRSGRTYPGAHKPLIPMELFETVQRVKAGKTMSRRTRHLLTYRGLFQCSNCGRSMIGERQKGHVYYRCQNPHCGANCIREEVLETAIIDQLDRIRLSRRDIVAITQTFEKTLRDGADRDRSRSMELQLGRVEVRLQRLTDALIDRLIDEAEFQTRKQLLLVEQTRLKQQLSEDLQNRIEPSLVRAALERLKNLAGHYRSAGSEDKREIACIATSNRKVWAKKAEIEPSNWLRQGLKIMPVRCGVHDRDAHRTKTAKNNDRKTGERSDTAQSLISLASAPEAKRLAKLMAEHCRQGVERSGDYPTNPDGA